MNEHESEPSTPLNDNTRFIPFYQNLYPKITLPEFDMKNYQINHIMNQYKYLYEKRKTRNNLKKKYVKLTNACLGREFFITVSELGMVGTSIALPIIIPFRVPISVTLTTCSTILRSTNGLIAKKINKHLEMESLSKAKLNSIEEKFMKAIKDGKITDEEFNDIEQEIINYGNIKSDNLNDYNNKGKNSKR